MDKSLLFILAQLLSIVTFAQTVNITVDASQNRKPVSPSIYGKNNSLSDDLGSPLSNAEWQRLRDVGIRLFRENSGNNATKYNWRLKLTSAPDWYNNVYPADWDYEAKSLQQNIPGAKGMYAFQLIGKVALNDDHNFDDWDYNSAQWWPGVNQNLAGGGTVNTDWNATKALVEGNPDLYLKNWPPDSTVAILDKWFGTGSGKLNLDQSAFQYWNMDNEPEIWEGTHDDVMPQQCAAEEFMQRYFAVAKKARAKFTNIKLVGFVPCSEWYWFAYPDGKGGSGKISYKGALYTWVEYFIMRIGEEQKASGIRLIDVIDLHTYLSASSEEELLQVHRVFYDKTFDYPGANGVKLLSPNGWDESITKEYIFKRINEWLTQYLGADHGVTLGSTESGWDDFNQMPLALNYASTLGVFANEGVELFTPWYWSPSYWEVVHLFSRYSKNISVKSTSDDDNNLSAYSTVSSDNDSLTVVLVNRYSSSKDAQVTLSNFAVTDGIYQVYTLKDLPKDNSTETFISHTNNALKSSNMVVSNNKLSLSLPAYSITSVILRTGAASGNYLGVSSSTIEFNSEAGSTEIIVSSNTSWIANSNQSWLTLSKVSGSNNVTITISASANASTEARTAIVTFTGTGVESQTITISQLSPKIYPADDLIIYNDQETLIQGEWSDGGTLNEVSFGAFEGTKHYRFNYDFSGWWAGYGLNLCNWAGDGSGYDFTGFESLRFACKLTGPATASIALKNADNSTSTEGVPIEGVGSNYQEFTIPLTSFTGMDLNDVGEIMVNVNGNESSGSGEFDIDNIRLGAKVITVGNSNLKKPFSLIQLQNYPNPFSTSTTIFYNVPENGHYNVRIFDLTGREIVKLVDKEKPAGVHYVEWNGTDSNGNKVDNGIYFYQLIDREGFASTGKMLLIK